MTQSNSSLEGLEKALLRWEWYPEKMNAEFKAMQDRTEEDFYKFSKVVYEEIQTMLRKAVLNAFEDYFSSIFWEITYPTEDDILLSPSTMHHGFSDDTVGEKFSLKSILALDSEGEYQPIIDRLQAIIEHLTTLQENENDNPTPLD